MKTFFLVALLSMSLTASAQITLTSSDFIGILHSAGEAGWSTNDTTGLRALELLNGPAKTWDFSPFPYVLDGTVSFSLVPYNSSVALFGDTSFATATDVLITSTDGFPVGWVYYKITDNGAWVLGNASTHSLGGTPYKSSWNTPGEQTYQFPLTYETTWQTDYISRYAGEVDTDYNEVNETYAVDGYGTLITPGPHSNDALRIREDIAITNHFGATSTQEVPTADFDCLTNGIYNASISADGNLTPEEVSYEEPTNSGVEPSLSSGNLFSLSLSENPISASSAFSFSLPQNSPVRVDLLNALGVAVQPLFDGEGMKGMNTFQFDPHALPNGPYFLRANAAGKTELLNVAIEK